MTDDWTDAIFALLNAHARFLVVGAHAMAVHGAPRPAEDLDLWVEPTPENAQRVWDALRAYGAPLDDLDIRVEDFSAPEAAMEFGEPPRRVDVRTSISGVARFEDAWRTRIEQPVSGRRVPFIGRDTLVANKRAAGRAQDLADLEALGVS